MTMSFKAKVAVPGREKVERSRSVARSSLVPGQLLGQPNGGEHAGGICFALTGDVIGRAMIGRGADEWQAQRPINAGVKTNHLERHEALVMIHGHYGVVVAFEGVVKQGVRA